MGTKACRVSCLFFITLALTMPLTATFCQGALQWHTDIQIEVFADGSSTWVVQERAQLATEDDEDAFWARVDITFPSNISDHVNSMVNYASLVTGRSMRTDHLGQINATVLSTGLNKQGIIQYQFDWIGFADTVADDGIYVGDVFSGEIDLSRDDVLTIKYPNGYAPISIYPSPDERHESERTLTWFGPRNFGAGEPHALFEKQSSSWTDIIAGNMPILALVVVAFSIGSLGYFLGMKHPLGKMRLNPNAETKQTPSSELRVEDDKEKIIKLLTATEGPVYQSAIAKEFGFSKSKASELLAVMERKGIISRKKMGRGKIVTLVKEEKTSNNRKHA